MNEGIINIYEYEGLILGKDSRFKSSFGKDINANKVEFGYIWRYAITHLLHWTPAIAEKYMTAEIMYALKLDTTLEKIGLKPQNIIDFRMVLQYAFPDDIHYSLKEEIIKEYKRSAKLDEFSSIPDDIEYRIPKNFYVEDKGITRANVLLNYVIDQYLSDLSIEELYSMFAEPRNINKWLRNKKLLVPMKTIYGNAIEYLHHALPENKKDYLLYYNYIIEQQCKSIIKAGLPDDNFNADEKEEEGNVE